MLLGADGSPWGRQIPCRADGSFRGWQVPLGPAGPLRAAKSPSGPAGPVWQGQVTPVTGSALSPHPPPGRPEDPARQTQARAVLPSAGSAPAPADQS